MQMFADVRHVRLKQSSQKLNIYSLHKSCKAVSFIFPIAKLVASAVYCY